MENDPKFSRVKFFLEFLQHPFETGAVLPSSSRLCQLLTQEVRANVASHIVELGSGTGVCTKEIEEARSPNSAFFVLELNPEFVEHTRRTSPGTEVICDSAQHLPDYLNRTEGKGFDAIVSGIPWAALPPQKQAALLDAIYASLSPGGRFVTFAYLQGLLLPSGRKFREMLKKRFPSVYKTHTVWNNVPPAFVYTAEKSLKH